MDRPLVCKPNLRVLTPGDHIAVGRGLYSHHGILIDEGDVVEYGGNAWGGPVQVVPWEDFIQGCRWRVVRHPVRFSREQTVERALRMIGMNRFDLWERNCEHFATWCCTGRWHSQQVETAIGAAKALFAVAVSWMLLRRA